MQIATHSNFRDGAVLEDDAAPLSATQLEKFREDGFLALPSPQLSETEIAASAAILNRLFDEGAGTKEGRQFDIAPTSSSERPSSPQILDPSNDAAALEAFKFRTHALKIARQVLGPNARFYGEHATRKAPRIGGPTPWHQDGAYRDRGYHFNELSIWIALDDVTVEKGAMKYIPGSHRNGVLTHQLSGVGNNANSLECTASFNLDACVACPLPPGGMVIHDVCTVHGAGPNLADSERLGYVLCFESPKDGWGKPGNFPWMTGLRNAVNDRRRSWLLRGGLLVEVVRRTRNDWKNGKRLSEFSVFSLARVARWLRNSLLRRRA